MDARSLGLDEPSPDCVTDQISSYVQVKFLHNPGAVGFRCFHANVQTGRDLFGGFAFGNQLQSLPLPVA